MSRRNKGNAPYGSTRYFNDLAKSQSKYISVKQKWSRPGKVSWRNRKKYRTKYPIITRVKRIERALKQREPELKYWNVTPANQAKVVHPDSSQSQSVWGMGDGILLIPQGVDEHQRIGDHVMEKTMSIRLMFNILPAVFSANNPTPTFKAVRIVVIQWRDTNSLQFVNAFSDLCPFVDPTWQLVKSPFEPEKMSQGHFAVLSDQVIEYERPYSTGDVNQAASGYDAPVSFSQGRVTVFCKPKWNPTWKDHTNSSILNPISVWVVGTPTITERLPTVSLTSILHTWRDNN